MTTAQAYYEDSYWYRRHVIDKHRRIIAEIIADCLCLIASGEDNTIATLGFDACDTEEETLLDIESKIDALD